MSGILLFALIAVACLLFLKAFHRLLKPNRSHASTYQAVAQPCALPYAAKRSLFSPAERNFLSVLEIALEGKARVYGKVRLEDIITVSGASGSKKMSARGRIRSRHIDFVLCDPTTSEFLAAIELDDRSHSTAKAIEVDDFKDQCFQTAGIPLLRFDAKHGYTMQEILTKLPNSLLANEHPTKTPTPNPNLPIALIGHPELERISTPVGHNGDIQLSQAPTTRLKASLKSEGYQPKKIDGSWIWSRN